MTTAEALDLIERIVLCYHDQFDESLPEEDREWNKVEFEELCDAIVSLLSKEEE